MSTEQMNSEALNLSSLARKYSDEEKARLLLESLRWPNGPVCPHCQLEKVYKIKPVPTSRSPGRNGLYKCAACRKQFTVTVGTIFAKTHIKIGTWLMGVSILCLSEKSVSSLQLSRMLDVTYKTAWLLTSRLRHAMSPNLPLGKLIKNVVQTDETPLSGKGESRKPLFRKIPVVTSSVTTDNWYRGLSRRLNRR